MQRPWERGEKPFCELNTLDRERGQNYIFLLSKAQKGRNSTSQTGRFQQSTLKGGRELGPTVRSPCVPIFTRRCGLLVQNKIKTLQNDTSIDSKQFFKHRVHLQRPKFVGLK